MIFQNKNNILGAFDSEEENEDEDELAKLFSQLEIWKISINILNSIFFFEIRVIEYNILYIILTQIICKYIDNIK